ncbi:MAG: DUF3105 domain-containing protein [Candidatus Portnoybacteria bacterium]|nr:DUF3105 domain-containing protein [Candidatus Portnoybacteria bacterium]
MNKKDLYEQRKQQKFEAKEARRKEQRKSQLFFGLAVGVPVLLIGGFISYILYTSSGAGIPDIGEFFADQGRTHIKEGEAHPAYNSNPPTSGWHYDTPVDWGVYKEETPEERLIHNLEHGGIVIEYKPDFDPSIIAKLEDLKTSEFECKLVVASNKNLDKNIAVRAWHRLYKTDAYDETIIKNFIKKYRDTGPELVPCSVKASQMQR